MLNQQDVSAARRLIPRDARARSELFRTLGDRQRYAIVCLLLKRSGLCVTDVARVLGLSIPAASHHLRILELVGLARRVRMGKMICYEANSDYPFADVVKRLCS